MTVIREGKLTFSFSRNCAACKYDEWSFYRNLFQRAADGTKAVDMICIENGAVWLIEVKDYRQHRQMRLIDLASVIARKARDTLAGLAAASRNANDDAEKSFARKAVRGGKWRLALHLEQLSCDSSLRKHAIDPADVKMKLRGLAKAIDPHPVVMDRQTGSSVPWQIG